MQEFVSDSLVNDEAVLVMKTPLVEKEARRDPTAGPRHPSVVTDAGRGRGVKEGPSR